MLPMNSSPAAPARRIVLVPAEPRAGRSDGDVRRFRLARLRLDGRDALPAERFVQAKR
jgi:hypothetical protein